MKSTRALIAAMPLAIALTSCGGGESEPAEGETVAEQAIDEQGAGAGTLLNPVDFAQLDLGARVEGPQGPVVTSRFEGPNGMTGRLEGYVACPAGVEQCDPADLPGDTVYTYVLTVTPDARASAFRTAVPVAGYAGGAGFDQAEATSAIGGDSQMELRCVNGGLFYSVLGSEGWAAGSPITFFWQGTTPPSGPVEAYELISGGDIGTAAGPAPGEGGDGC